MSNVKKLIPKRFTDRKDCFEIVNAAKGFSYRSHNTVPSWLYYFFAMMVVWYFVVLLYVSLNVLREKSADMSTLYVVQYLLVSFLIFAGFITFMVRKFRRILNAVEFIGLSMYRTLENYTGAYCLLNEEGKIFYYNFEFSKTFMCSNEVETKKYEELLTRELFDTNAFALIKDSLENKKPNSCDLTSGNMALKIFPLARPEGVFAVNIVAK